MNDQQTAALLIGIGVVWFVLWYRRRGEEERAYLFGSGQPSASTPVKPSASTWGTPLDRLLGFARVHGLAVTSTRGGRHNPGSAHYLGKAIDVRSRGLTEEFVQSIISLATAAGIRVRDERTRPRGQAVWGGPHLHLEVD